MTAPLPMPAIAPAAPALTPTTPSAKPAATAAASEKGPSFSDVLAQQRPSPSANAQPADGAKTPVADATPPVDSVNNAEAAAPAIDPARQTAIQAEAGALAVAATQQPVTPIMLPQQTLDIAAQAAEQVQLARGAAPAAVSAVGSGAAAVRPALTAHEAIAAPRMPLPAAAAQPAEAAAQPSRDARIAQPPVTAALKPDSAPAADASVFKTPAAALTRHAPEPAPSHAPPLRAAAEPEPRTRGEETPAAPALSTPPQLPPPPHAANAQDHLAQAIAAATQHPPSAPSVTPASSAMPNAPMTLQVATPVGATHWGTELGQQMVVMSHNLRQGTQTAELRLDPPDLGPLRVSLNLADGVASASFVSAHASVRQAIETAMPQLQQALAQAGISLGQTSVGEQAAQQEFARQHGGGSPRQGAGHDAAAANGAVDEGLPGSVTVTRNANALIDTFA